MRRRLLLSLLTVCALGLGVGAAALAQGSASTPTVFDVTPTSAQVTAVVDPPGNVGSYWFEWGTDDSYGTKGDPIALGVEKGAREVGGTISGLQPSTTYYVRVVVKGNGEGNDGTTSQGVGFTTAADTTSTTTTPAPPPGEPEKGEGAQFEPAQTVETAPPDPDQAEQGQAVVLAPESGTVMVKQAGTDDFAEVHAGTPVPVGSTVDTTQGAVRLIAETPGATQDVVLRGSQFEVRQSRAGTGITEFVLKGGDFASCGRAASSATRKKKVRRSLWARDNGGKFRTRGRNSVATVRGTTWRVTDTCSGTTTSVTSGSVLVRELRSGDKFVVRRGHSHLARSR
jgi:hypothetical protein